MSDRSMVIKDLGLAVVVELGKSQAMMYRELQEDLHMDARTLVEHAITSLWVSVQLQRAAARLK